MKIAYLFKRKTSSGRYIPQLDGLRFIAILSVLLYHTNELLQKRWTVNPPDSSSQSILNWFNTVLRLGSFGVPVFFAISGYILSQPIWNVERFNYKHYLKRRVSRIEPPFVITTIIFAIAVWFQHKLSLQEFGKEFFTTLLYLHNLLIPAYNSKINSVTWSLEIEVQFYLLIPFLILFLRKKKYVAGIIISLAAVFYLYNIFFTDRYRFLNDYINYFFIGILVSYINEKTFFRKRLGYFPGLNFLLVVTLYLFQYAGKQGYMFFDFLNYGIFFLLFYNVLVTKNGIRFLSYKLISYIGGMCYTIYLIHYPIATRLADKCTQFLPHSFPGYFISIILIITITIAVCAVIFLILEKPFMKRDWYKAGKVKYTGVLATGD